MYIKLRRGVERDLTLMGISKAGSERKLAKTLGIHHSAIHDYKFEKRNMSEKRFNKLITFLGIKQNKVKKIITNKLDKNWGRKLGGINCYKKKIKNGRFTENLKKMNKALRKWHENMKINNSERYYKMQHEKFKKISGFKFKTLRGENVRNLLEKKVADLLFKSNLEYQYEPLIRVSSNSYFPDFKFGNILIECSMWKGRDKASKLLKKINEFKKSDYKVLVIIPKHLRKYYKTVDKFVVEFEELGNVLQAPVAQTDDVWSNGRAVGC